MNNATVTFTITPTGPSAAAILAAMQNPPTLGGPGVPEPVQTLIQMGLRVTSDTQIGPNGLTRQLSVAFGPSAAATAVAVLANDATLAGVTVTGAGNDYVLPPVVSFTGGGIGGANLLYTGKNPTGYLYPSAIAYLNVQNDTVVYPGAGYNAGTIAAFLGGLPPALFLQPTETRDGVHRDGDPAANGPPYAVNAISLYKSGSFYSAATYIQFQGGDLTAGGHHARAVITGIGPNGQILGVQLIDPGALYQTIPKMVFIDPTPSANASRKTQAKCAVSMGAGIAATATVTLGGGGSVTGLAGLTSGTGYVQPPTILIYDGAIVPGTGALVTPRMGLDKINMTFPGKGLVTVPTVVLTPYFKSLFPDASDQRTPFYNFPMEFAIEQATASQVVPGVPVLS